MKNYFILFIYLGFFPVCLGQTPSTAEEYLDQAMQLMLRGNPKGALGVLSEGIKVMPDSVELYDSRGTLFDAFQMYPEAIRDFSMGLAKANNNKMKSHLLANRGGIKSKIRNFEGAYDDLIKAVKLNPKNVDALNNLATVCDEVNKPDETLKYLNKILKINPNYAPAYVNIGFAYQVRNHHKKAIKHFDKAIKIDANEPLAYSNRSFSKLKINDMDGAMEDINKSIRLMPSNSYAYKIRALIHLENKTMERVCQDLSRANQLGYTQQYGEEVNELLEKHCQ